MEPVVPADFADRSVSESVTGQRSSSGLAYGCQAIGRADLRLEVEHCFAPAGVGYPTVERVADGTLLVAEV